MGLLDFTDKTRLDFYCCKRTNNNNSFCLFKQLFPPLWIYFGFSYHSGNWFFIEINSNNVDQWHCCYNHSLIVFWYLRGMVHQMILLVVTWHTCNCCCNDIHTSVLTTVPVAMDFWETQSVQFHQIICQNQQLHFPTDIPNLNQDHSTWTNSQNLSDYTRSTLCGPTMECSLILFCQS